jgi:hypothetical protein
MKNINTKTILLVSLILFTLQSEAAGSKQKKPESEAITEIQSSIDSGWYDSILGFFGF